jgi:hypothetical protein
MWKRLSERVLQPHRASHLTSVVNQNQKHWRADWRDALLRTQRR